MSVAIIGWTDGKLSVLLKTVTAIKLFSVMLLKTAGVFDHFKFFQVGLTFAGKPD